jgi:hypothetical protein
MTNEIKKYRIFFEGVTGKYNPESFFNLYSGNIRQTITNKFIFADANK